MSRSIIAVLLAVSSLTVLAGAVVAPALPGIRETFIDTPGVDVLSRLVLTLPALGVALAGALAGRFADRFGLVRTLVVGLVAYGLAGTTGLWVSSLSALLAGRFALGLSVAVVMTCATALLAGLGQGEAQRRLMSLQAAAMGLGGLLFLTLGGALTEISWRGPFAVYVLAWILAPFVLWIGVPQSSASTSPTAAIASTPTMASRLLPFAVLGMALFFLLPTQMPFVVESVFGASASMTGVVLGGATLMSALVSFVFPRLRGIYSPCQLLTVTFVVMGVGLILLALAPSLPLAGLALLVVGSGAGLLMPNFSSWIAQVVAPEQRGRALGRLTASVFLGQFLSPLLVAPGLWLGLSLHATIAAGGALSIAAGLLAGWLTRQSVAHSPSMAVAAGRG